MDTINMDDTRGSRLNDLKTKDVAALSTTSQEIRMWWFLNIFRATGG
jgi:hypothetical protein